MKSGVRLVAGLVIISLITLAVLFLSRLHVAAPNHVKLSDCLGQNVAIHQTLPQGDVFQVLLAVPRSTQLSDISGHLTINQTDVGQIEGNFDSTNLTECNWLHEHPELRAFILTFPLHWKDGVGDFPLTGKACDIMVKFSKTPPPGSSLWLSWVSD